MAKARETRLEIPPEATQRMKSLDEVAMRANDVLSRAQADQRTFINGYLLAKGIHTKHWELTSDRKAVLYRS